jgi:hypothetical protein
MPAGNVGLLTQFVNGVPFMVGVISAIAAFATKEYDDDEYATVGAVSVGGTTSVQFTVIKIHAMAANIAVDGSKYLLIIFPPI